MRGTQTTSVESFQACAMFEDLVVVFLASQFQDWPRKKVQIANDRNGYTATL